jgi:hypothetical protein
VKAVAGLAAACLALAAAACNKAPAEDALAEADQQIAAARPELQVYAPGELEALEAAVRQARAQVGEGHYTDALRTAQHMPDRVRAALVLAVVQKQKRLAAWQEMAASVPGLVETIETRVSWLVEKKRLPRGMDEAAFAAAQAELDSAKRAWSEAAAAFEGGDVLRALRAGQEVKARAEALAASLALSPPAPAAPTPSPAAPAR